MANRIHNKIISLEQWLEGIRQKNRPVYYIIIFPSVALPTWLFTTLGEKFIDELSWGAIMKALGYLVLALLLCSPIAILSFFEVRAARNKSAQMLWSGWIVAFFLAIALAWSIWSSNHSKPKTVLRKPLPDIAVPSLIQTSQTNVPSMQESQEIETNSPIGGDAESLYSSAVTEKARAQNIKDLMTQSNFQANWENNFQLYTYTLTALHDTLSNFAYNHTDQIVMPVTYYGCLPKAANPDMEDVSVAFIRLLKETNLDFKIGIGSEGDFQDTCHYWLSLKISCGDGYYQTRPDINGQFYIHVLTPEYTNDVWPFCSTGMQDHINEQMAVFIGGIAKSQALKK